MKKDSKVCRKIVFFLQDKPNIRGGGPAGYIANLEIGFKKIEETIPLVSSGLKEGRLIKLFSFWCPFKNRRCKIREYLRLNIFTGPVGFSKYLTKKAQRILLNKDLKWILTESVLEFCIIKKFAMKNNLSAKIVLMSHCPERPSKELGNSYKLKLELGKISQKQCNRFIAIEENLENYAFKTADLILFPSKGAMDPYFETWPEFQEIIKGKEIYFLETGCAPLDSTNFSRERGIEKFGLNPKPSLRICFIGRHQEVKGYDLLVKAASKVWEQIPDAEFVIGGNPKSTITPPEDKRWKECGYINPAELLKTADVFVLPNRRTYFDLVLLEVLSSGVPVIATKTGGNKDVALQVEKDGGKIFLCEPSAESIAAEILSFSKLSQSERECVGESLVVAYQKNYTPEAFAQRYLELFKKLI